MPGIWRMLSLAALLLLGGCNAFLADRMIVPPNGHSTKDPVDATLAANQQLLTVGPPNASLAFWVLEPRPPVRGTILALHGFITDHSQVAPAGRALQAAGYRVVLVDLRGHGKSLADHITYGVQDAKDLSQLTDYLQRRRLAGRSIGVFGTSYGAASAILFAGQDSRVKAVVAVAPFSTLREEAPYFGQHLMPLPGLFMSADDYITVVNRMGAEAGFDPDACSPLAAIAKTKAQVLLFHGTADLVVPSHASEELAAAAPGHSQLTLLPGKGHLALCLDWFGELRPQTQAWFDQYLATRPPPAPVTPGK
jgi:pimeloyl-ACP methyl ester carboxylesterase